MRERVRRGAAERETAAWFSMAAFFFYFVGRCVGLPFARACTGRTIPPTRATGRAEHAGRMPSHPDRVRDAPASASLARPRFSRSPPLSLSRARLARSPYLPTSLSTHSSSACSGWSWRTTTTCSSWPRPSTSWASPSWRTSWSASATRAVRVRDGEGEEREGDEERGEVVEGVGRALKSTGGERTPPFPLLCDDSPSPVSLSCLTPLSPAW